MRAYRWSFWGLGTACILTSFVSLMVAAGGSLPTGKGALLACLVTESGSAHWVAIPLIVLLLLLLLDQGLDWRRRRRLTIRLLTVLIVTLPLFALVNEHLVKRVIREPRPSHVALANAGYIDDIETFYEMSRRDRQALLAPLTSSAGVRQATQRLGVDHRVLAQWVHEVSSSFPSGHASNAFLAVALILLAITVRATRSRMAVCALALLWATAVSTSRVLLGVHHPVDVIVGALLGIVVALLVGRSLQWPAEQHDAPLE